MNSEQTNQGQGIIRRLYSLYMTCLSLIIDPQEGDEEWVPDRYHKERILWRRGGPKRSVGVCWRACLHGGCYYHSHHKERLHLQGKIQWLLFCHTRRTGSSWSLFSNSPSWFLSLIYTKTLTDKGKITWGKETKCYGLLGIWGQR